MPCDKGGKVILLDEMIYDAKVRRHTVENENQSPEPSNSFL